MVELGKGVVALDVVAGEETEASFGGGDAGPAGGGVFVGPAGEEGGDVVEEGAAFVGRHDDVEAQAGADDFARMEGGGFGGVDEPAQEGVEQRDALWRPAREVDGTIYYGVEGVEQGGAVGYGDGGAGETVDEAVVEPVELRAYNSGMGGVVVEQVDGTRDCCGELTWRGFGQRGQALLIIRMNSHGIRGVATAQMPWMRTVMCRLPSDMASA